MRFVPAVWLAFLVVMAPGLSRYASAAETAAEASSYQVEITHIEGSEHVTAVSTDEEPPRSRDLGEGGFLHSGDKVSTATGISVTLRYPDGSRITLNPGSTFVIELHENGMDGNRLENGRVQGNVAKTPAAPDTPNRKLHFLIRSKSAVMGVRGTEFVMSMDDATSVAQVDTLEGTVEVAPTEAALLDGQGIAVGAGQSIQATPTGLGPVHSTESAAAGIPAAPVPGTPELAKKGAPAAPEAKTEEAGRSLHLLELDFGGLIVPSSGTFGSSFGALAAHWTPSVPVPWVPFLRVRGELGGNLAGGPSGSKPFDIVEMEGCLELSIFKTLFAEGAYGRQWFKPQSSSGALLSIRGGLLLSQDGFFNRLFVGYSSLSYPGSNDREYRTGLGINL